jgi:hypothetical protein
MSRFAPPPAPDAGYASQETPPQAPLSKAAVAGFVSALVILIPVVTQLLGGVLGIVGIVRTARGRQRGRGLAIAAVCISAIALVGWLILGAAGATVYTLVAVGARVEPLLNQDAADRLEAVQRFREDSFSARLKLTVDQPALMQFLDRVREQYGTLTTAAYAGRPLTRTADGQGITAHRVGEFSLGRANIDVVMGFDGWSPQIDNLTVGDFTG